MESPSPSESWRLPKKGDRTPDSGANWRQSMRDKKPSKGGNSKDLQQLKRSDNAYKIGKAQTREAEIQREVRGQLNKICPENKDVIIQRVANIRVDDVEELTVVIDIIFHKVTDDPHYCDTYVDMIVALHKTYPEFPATSEDEQPATFRRMLVNTCQDKFEEMVQVEDEQEEEKLAAMDPEEKLAYSIKKKRNNMATMKFIGNLFVKGLLAAAVIRRVLGDLLDGEPPEMQVEFALELLQAVGPSFEKNDKDKAQIQVVMHRLRDLKVMKTSEGKSLLSKRVQFQIDDMKDLQNNGWKKKNAIIATTKDEVARQQDAEEAAANRHGGGKGHGKYR